MKQFKWGFLFVLLMALPVLMIALTACSSKEVQPTQVGLTDEERARLAEEERLRQQRLSEMELTRQAKDVFESEMVHFDYDKYNIRPDAAEVLQRKAQFMKEHPNLVTEIQGHCDNRGTEAYNLALGDRRAYSAKKYMMDVGIGSNRMSTISYGEERPIDTAENEYAWALNRRVQFEATGN